jgi:hypothetical protein
MTIKLVMKKEGIKGFYKGLSTTLMRGVPVNASGFMAYEYVLNRLDDSKMN